MSKSFKNFVYPSITTVFIFFLLRIYEFSLTKQLHNIALAGVKFEAFGVLSDIILMLGLTAVFYILLFPFFFINKKIPVIIFKTILLILSLCSIPLIKYFTTVLYPLDGVLFKYSFEEITTILNTGASLELKDILPFPILILLFFGSNHLLKYKRAVSPRFSKKLMYISFLAVPLSLFSNLKPEYFEKRVDYFLFSNKITYLINNRNIKEEKLDLTEVNKYVENYRKTHPNKQFQQKEYPFLHTNNYPNTLISYFKLKETKPNVVILIIESLTSLKCGPGARFGSYTPFLDSLINHSLYWANFLSAAERTFGVLPSSLGSLPYGNKGFMSLGEKMPRNFSLLNLLKKNGYYTSFFYGGNTSFDNMKNYLIKQETDYIMEFDYYKKNGLVYWGVSDDKVYNASLHKIDSINIPSPRLDIYLTLSSHGPFDLPNMDSYQKRIKEMMLNYEKTQNISDHSIAMEEFNTGILYTDDQLKMFFNKYKKRNDYENTIFVIYGDHGLSAIDPNNVLSKYNVPLIIYSPLLKKPQKFKGISTHLDITPTLLSLLKDKYNLELPEKVHWRGNSLNTSKTFMSSTEMAFMNVGRTCQDYISGEYFAASNQLFKIQENLQLKKVNNDKLLDEINNKLSIFRKMNFFVCNNNRLLPKEDFVKFGKEKELITMTNIEFNDKDSTAEYVSIFKIKQNRKYKNYSFLLEGEFLSKDTTRQLLPSFVVTSRELETDSVLSYSDDYFVTPSTSESFKSTQWNKILLSQNTGITANNTQYKVDLYFWNPHKTPIRFKNLTLKAYGIPR